MQVQPWLALPLSSSAGFQSEARLVNSGEILNTSTAGLVKHWHSPHRHSVSHPQRSHVCFISASRKRFLFVLDSDSYTAGRAFTVSAVDAVKAKLQAASNTAEIGSRFGGQNIALLFAELQYLIFFLLSFFKGQEGRNQKRVVQSGLLQEKFINLRATYFKRRQQLYFRQTNEQILYSLIPMSKCVAKTKSSKVHLHNTATPPEQSRQSSGTCRCIFFRSLIATRLRSENSSTGWSHNKLAGRRECADLIQVLFNSTSRKVTQKSGMQTDG